MIRWPTYFCAGNECPRWAPLGALASGQSERLQTAAGMSATTTLTTRLHTTAVQDLQVLKQESRIQVQKGGDYVLQHMYNREELVQDVP